MDDLQTSLHEPVVFQKKYGNNKRIIAGSTLPATLWSGVTLKGWLFKQVHFQGTQWKGVTVIDGVFDGCTFDSVVFEQNKFINTEFINNHLISSNWNHNQFHGGTWEGMTVATVEIPEEILTTTFAHNSFDSVAITHLLPFQDLHNHPLDWDSCQFHFCHFEKNILQNIYFRNSTFTHSVFTGNILNSSVFSVGTIIRNSTLQNNLLNESNLNATWYDSTHITTWGNFSSNGKVSYSTISPIGNGSITIEDADHLQLKHINSLKIAHAHHIEVNGIEDKDATVSLGSINHSTFQNLHIKTLQFDSLEDVRFEKVVVDRLQGKLSCTRCTFLDVQIKGKITPQDSIRMPDCKFENVHAQDSSAIWPWN